MHNKNPRLTKNSFDLLRLLFAGTVCLIHAYQLSGFQQLRWITNILSSVVAIKSFFVISGFLIFMSYERSTSIRSYASKRFRRIYPAYFTVVIICAISLVTVSSRNVEDYFSYLWLKYILANLTFLNFLQLTLPGVFETNKLAFVNGALWTLKIEIMFYLSVPIFVYLFRKFNCLTILVFTYFSSVAYITLLSIIADHTGAEIYKELSRQLPGQLSYFISGGFFYYYLRLFERRVGLFLLGAVSILAINHYFPIPLIEPFALATVVIFCGLFLYVGNFGKYGDFSYGIYILHFPIIQVFISEGWFHDSPWYFFISVIFVTLTGAIVMWHIVEKRFLLRNSHYIIATSSVGDKTFFTAILGKYNRPAS